MRDCGTRLLARCTQMEKNVTIYIVRYAGESRAYKSEIRAKESLAILGNLATIEIVKVWDA